VEPVTDKVLALDIGATKLAAGIGRLDGTIERQATIPTQGHEGAETVLQRALGLARACLDAERADGGQLTALGISTMGLTRATHVDLAPNVPGWETLRIPEAVRRAFPEQTVVFGNDVKVAARAEMRWGALRDVEHGIYLNLGSGIAAGVIAGGQLIEGAHGAAGEVGYTLSEHDEPGPSPAREGRAPFEDFYGGTGAARRLPGSGLPGSVAELVAVEGADRAAHAFLDELWNGIARLAANLCCVLDPSVLALGGGYLRGESRLMPVLREVVARAVPYPPAVVPARFGADASLRGAAAAAFDELGAG
jgi:glucokinase